MLTWHWCLEVNVLLKCSQTLSNKSFPSTSLNNQRKPFLEFISSFFNPPFRRSVHKSQAEQSAMRAGRASNMLLFELHTFLPGVWMLPVIVTTGVKLLVITSHMYFILLPHCLIYNTLQQWVSESLCQCWFQAGRIESCLVQTNNWIQQLLSGARCGNDVIVYILFCHWWPCWLLLQRR